MKQFDFKIGGTTREISTVWAHLQDPYKQSQPTDFSLNIPLRVAYGLVNPEAAPVPNAVLVDKFKEHLNVFGTVSADFLLRHLRKSADLKPQAYEWVLASIDSAQVVSEEFRIEGRVVPFAPNSN